MTRRPDAVLALLLAASAAAAAIPALAQTKPGPVFQVPELPPRSNAPAAPPSTGQPCQHSLREESGVVTLSLRDPGRANQSFSFRADGLPYLANFDGSGALEARAPIFHETAEISWSDGDGKTACKASVTFQSFRYVYLTALVWSGPYELGLHVTEPDGMKIGSVAVASEAAEAPAAASGGLGTIESFGLPGGDGTHVLLYRPKAIARPPQAGEIYFFIEFLSRGNPAHAPFCDGGTASVASYHLVHLDEGTLQLRHGEFGAVPCGTSWGSDEEGFSPPFRWRL
jgi:hypothetical protein